MKHVYEPVCRYTHATQQWMPKIYRKGVLVASNEGSEVMLHLHRAGSDSQRMWLELADAEHLLAQLTDAVKEARFYTPVENSRVSRHDACRGW